MVLLVFLFSILFILLASKKEEDESTITFQEMFDMVSNEYIINYDYSHPLDTVYHLPFNHPFNHDVRYYLESRENFKCPSSKYADIVIQLDDGTFNIKPSEDIIFFTCFYRVLTGNWMPLKRGLTVNEDQFVVKCVEDKTNYTVFLDVFANIGIKPKMTESTLKKQGPNVILLVLDSVSNAQFHRHMSKTIEFLKRRDVSVMRGHSAISFNKTLNMMTMLGGKIYDGFKNGFKNEFRKGLLFPYIDHKLEYFRDNLTYKLNSLIEQARDLGYITMYNEDIIRYNEGLFHTDGLYGFSTPPADFYFRPYYQYMYKLFSENTSEICLNGVLTGHRTLDLMNRFSTKYQNEPHFSFNYVGTAHYNPNDLYLLDEKLSTILETWDKSGILDKSALILTSNHGQLKHPIHKTFFGRVEERTPLAILYLPEQYKKEYPEETKTLKFNENRVASHIDLYATIQEIIKARPDILIGRSLFKEKQSAIPCAYHGIPQFMCPCWIRYDENSILNDLDKKMIMNKLIDPVNDILINLPCISEYIIHKPIGLNIYSLPIDIRVGANDALSPERIPLAKNYTAEYYDIQTVIPSNVTFYGKVQMSLRIRNRITYNLITGETLYFIKPFVKFKDCKGRALENLCNCFQQDQ